MVMDKEKGLSVGLRLLSGREDIFRLLAAIRIISLLEVWSRLQQFLGALNSEGGQEYESMGVEVWGI